MRRFLIVIAASFLSVAFSSVARSQTAPPPTTTTEPQPAPATGTPAIAPGAIPALATPPNAAIDQKQVSYALGRQFATNMKRNEIPCDMESLFAGIRDVLTGAQPQYTDEQLGATMQRFMQDMQQKAKSRMEQQVALNKKLEEDFLAKNKIKPGVETTASGLQYKVIKAGTGASPTAADVVSCDYRGVLLDGTEFDSATRHGGPQTFRVGEVIPGWTEALQKMKVGDKWELYVPAALAYDMDPPGDPIEPGSMLIFEIELLGIGGQ